MSKIWAASALGAAASVISIASGCASLPPCPARGGPVWRQFSSENFEVKTDLDVPAARQLVVTLEETRAAMLGAVWGGAPGPTHPTSVIAFASSGEMEEFGGFGIGGMHVQAAPFPATMVISAATFKQDRFLRHELAHDLSFWFLPFQPRWFSEGMGTFLETARYDTATGWAIVGEPSPECAWAIHRRGLASMDVLFGPVPDNIIDLAFFETSSWVLVHYLLNNREEAFRRFQRRLGELEPATQAWHSEFPDLDRETLYATLTGYVQSGSYVISHHPMPAWHGEVEVRTLSDAEVHGTRAYLYAYVSGPESGAQPRRSAAEIKEALREDPNALDAMAIAFYAPSPRRPIDIGLSRADLASRASRAHPEAWLSWVMVSDSRSVQDPVARDALAQALRIDPDHPEILARMATVKAAGGDWNGALAFASKALRGRYVSDDLWLLYMEGLAKTGRCGDAALWNAAVVAYLPDKRAHRVTREWTRIRQACVAAAAPPAP